MTSADVVIRQAAFDDLAAENLIYNHLVVHTHVSFDEVGCKNGHSVLTMLMERKLTDDRPTSGEG